MKDYSYTANAHPSYIENLYKNFQQDPNAVDSSWQQFFKGFEFATDHANGNGSTATIAISSDLKKEFAVLTIIDGFRHRGHLLSDTNPIRPRKNRFAHLDIADWGLEESDRAKNFQAGEVIGLKNATLQQILDRLNQIYTGHIGFEYAHIENHERRLWLRERIEKRNLNNDFGLPLETKRRIAEKLNGAVGMEEFLAKKYGPTKRFGLEGGETTIPAIDSIIQMGAKMGVEEVVIGMAHRGRLNMLANIMGKTYEHIFNEFEGGSMPDQTYGSGDVKYHMGYSSQITAEGKNMYLKLLPNPSHLEAVDAVMEGFARAKADILYGSEYDKILPIMVHGDASVAGQGIVYEIVQMSQLEGYKTGGTVHFVINNQVGFTTDFEDARSSFYSTSVASVIDAPTFHVNGDDPEAVIFACQVATEYRQVFNCDVFIDMVCYRRNGHNESDNPEVTQPQLYKLIKNHKNPREIYSETLAQRNEIDKALSQEMAKSFDDNLQARLAAVKEKPLPYTHQEPELAWKQLKKKADDSDFDESPATGLKMETLQKVLNHLKTMPEGFKAATPIKRMFEKSYPETLEKGILDWALGELLAYGTILEGGNNIRFSGEDVKRGTFSHRNVVLFDTETNQQYNRLAGISEKAKFYIYNSLLSEYAVLGYEYGYAMASPDALVLWEAQFGDFMNGAQILIDQFIVAGESKWQRQNGLVMLLPHGFEGQGPEHSSARFERFLQSCAENNITVANVTTPANFFHIIRRQLIRPFRKPLVIMSPKSLLRHPLCVSNVADFAEGTRFQEVIDDKNIAEAKKVKKVVFCTGKIYYDLFAKQQEEKKNDIAIVRIEQMYPFPEKQVKAILEKYSAAKAKIWVQEEPANMGAWGHIATFHSDLGLQYIGRKAAASPATGYLKIHNLEQAEIVTKALN